MRISVFVFINFILLFGCSITEPVPYQTDRKPEERTEYNGIRGVLQQQKDQGYLLDKELQDKCINAKVDLTVAETSDSKLNTEKLNRIIEKTCR